MLIFFKNSTYVRLYTFSSRYRFAEQSHRCDTVWPHLPEKLSLQYLSYASWKIFKPSLYFFLSWLYIYRFAENNHGCAAVRSRLSRQWKLLLASYIQYFLHFSDSLRTTTARPLFCLGYPGQWTLLWASLYTFLTFQIRWEEPRLRRCSVSVTGAMYPYLSTFYTFLTLQIRWAEPRVRHCPASATCAVLWPAAYLSQLG